MALHYMKSPQTPQQQYLEDARWTPPPSTSAQASASSGAVPQCLTVFTDTLQFNFIVPSFEKVFFGQNYHKYDFACLKCFHFISYLNLLLDCAW